MIIKKKNVMGSQRIPFLDKLSHYNSIFKLHLYGGWNTRNSAIHQVNRYEKLKEIFKKYNQKNLNEIKVLEIGCGQRAITTLLFHTFGIDITGMDVEIPTFKMSLKILYDIFHYNGFERAVKSLMRHIFFDRTFFNNIEKTIRRKLNKNAKFKLADIQNLTFGEEQFDLIYSFWTFEHIKDIDSSFENINIMLEENGIVCVGVHLYPSLSGGHCPYWMKGEEIFTEFSVPPWDHLRENSYKANCYLNKFKTREYLDMLEKYFEILDIKYEYEGEGLLTDEILAETSDFYTRDDLITRSMTAICRKKRSEKFMSPHC